MRGSVRRAPQGRPGWQARYRDPLGVSRTRTFPTRADAEAFLNVTVGAIGRGEWIDPALGRITFDEWCEKYFASTRKRETTAARDRTVVRKHLKPTLGRRRISSITPTDIRGVVATMEKTLAPLTVATNYGVLRAIMNGAVNADLLVRTPCRGITLPKAETKRKRRALDITEIRRLADALPPDYAVIAYVGGILGLRKGEVFGLRVGKIDFLRRTILVDETTVEVEGRLHERTPVKTRSSNRTFHVPQLVIDLLSQHLATEGRRDPDDLVFTSPNGRPIRSAAFRTRVWLPAVKKAGLDGFTFHELRHSAGALMIQAGVHLETVKERLGHSSSRVTSEIYSHILPAVDLTASNALQALLTDHGGTAVVLGSAEGETAT